MKTHTVFIHTHTQHTHITIDNARTSSFSIHSTEESVTVNFVCLFVCLFLLISTKKIKIKKKSKSQTKHEPVYIIVWMSSNFLVKVLNLYTLPWALDVVHPILYVPAKNKYDCHIFYFFFIFFFLFLKKHKKKNAKQKQ